MKLKPTTFYAAFPDGLLLMNGHEFEACGRTWVVHKRRDPYQEWNRGYTISDKETGFGITETGMPEILNRERAAEWAVERLEKFSAREIARVIKVATKRRETLKVIA
jgi:hypothetical protein